MADGATVPISDIDVGDLVAARDPYTGELTAQPVLNVIVGHGDKHLIEVVTAPAPADVLDEGQAADDDPRADAWTATTNHPIWVEEQGWTDADDLAVGDLLQGATGELRIVQELDDHGWLHGQTVYNLSVANVHTFIVGDSGDGTLVHNCASSRRFSSDQDAVIQLARDAKGRGGLTPKEARILDRFRKEAGLYGHGILKHPSRVGAGGKAHINVGPIKHIPVRRTPVRRLPNR